MAMLCLWLYARAASARSLSEGLTDVRISLVGPTYPYKGGIAQYTTELAHRLTAAGHVVSIESWSRQYPKRLYPGQLTIDEPEMPTFPTVARTLSWRRPDTWYRVGRRLRGIDAVVLVVATPIQMPAYRGVLAGLGRHGGSRVVAQCHNVLPHERRAVDARLMKGVLSRVDSVLVHTTEQQTIAETLTNRPIVVQEMAPILIARKVGKGPGGLDVVNRRILFFGMVRPYKGLDLLLRAMPGGPGDVQLRVAGEFWGGVGETARLVSELGLQRRVELRPGYVDVADVPDLFADVDALVLPYRSATASFNALLAFEHGVPVIATDVGTMRQDVRDGVDGLICEPNDVSALSDVLRRFYADGVPHKLRAGVPRVDPAPRWAAYVSALLRAAETRNA